MLLGVLQAVQFIPAIAEGSSNIFHLFSQQKHKIGSKETKIIKSGVIPSLQSSNNPGVGILKNKLQKPFQLLNGHVFMNDFGKQILYKIKNNSNSEQTIDPASPIASIAFQSLANMPNVNNFYSHDFYCTQKVKISPLSTISINKQAQISQGYPTIFEGINNDNIITSLPNQTTTIMVKNLTQFQMQLDIGFYLGRVGYTFYGLSPSINGQTNPSIITKQNVVTSASSNVCEFHTNEDIQFGPNEIKELSLPYQLKNLDLNTQSIFLAGQTIQNIKQGVQIKDLFLSAITNKLNVKVKNKNNKNHKLFHHHSLIRGIFHDIGTITTKILNEQIQIIQVEQYVKINLPINCFSFQLMQYGSNFMNIYENERQLQIFNWSNKNIRIALKKKIIK